MKDHGRRVGCIDRGHETKRATFRRFIPRSANEIESRFDIGRSDGMAIVELNVFAQVKDPGQRIGRFPRFGEVAVEIHLGVAYDKAGEQQAVDALREGVGRKTGIEVGGIGFEEKRQRVGIGAGIGRAARKE